MHLICPMNDLDICKQNFLASPLIPRHRIHLVIDPKNICQEINWAIRDLDVDMDRYCILLHQDVYLPDDFEFHFEKALNEINVLDPNWAILGVAGGAVLDTGCTALSYICECGVLIDSGMPFPYPMATLDECFLVLNLKHGLRLDESLGSHHLFGTDLCLQARAMGLTSYLIGVPVHHNHREYKNETAPQEYLDVASKLAVKWKVYLPIPTSCTVLTYGISGKGIEPLPTA